MLGELGRQGFRRDTGAILSALLKGYPQWSSQKLVRWALCRWGRHAKESFGGFSLADMVLVKQWEY